MTARKARAVASGEGATALPPGIVPERIVVFTLEGQRYALPIEVVQEIQQLVAVSGLPDASPAIVGVIDLRGTVVAVVDLRLLVGLPGIEYGLQTPMLFVRTAKGLVALIVDEVEDVMEVPPGSAQPPSTMYALSDRLLCVVRLEVGMVFVFDVDRLVPPEAVAMAGCAS
jgi:purine-binding chemotaxis protein CheW